MRARVLGSGAPTAASVPRRAALFHFHVRTNKQPHENTSHLSGFEGEYGAGCRVRTRDPLITNQVLYQLS